jgi:undecaprenyl-diphosphatase
LFADKIEERLFNSYVVSSALIVGGIVLLMIERSGKAARIEDIKSLKYSTAIAIGFIQCLAMIPGTSRSAATILVAMALGASRAVAAEFSFFLAIPTMVGASGYSLFKTGFDLTLQQWQVLGVGFVVSFLVAWGVVAVFMNYIRRNDFKPFAYYRIVLGVLVFAYFFFTGAKPY